MRKILLLALLAGVGYAHAASVLFEPYIGYDVGKNRISNSLSNSVQGVTYGGRLGVQQMGLSFGLDYMTGHWNDSASPQNTITPENTGVFVGYHFPMMVSAYAEYIFADRQKFSSGGSSFTFDGGNGVKAGVGVKLVPMVVLGFEYFRTSYNKLSGGAIDPQLKNEMFGISLSLPFTFW